MKVSEIAFPGDRIVTFSAIVDDMPSDAAPPPPPNDTPARATVFSLGTSTDSHVQSQTPSRVPLQPINRQLSIPSKESVDKLVSVKREHSENMAAPASPYRNTPLRIHTIREATPASHAVPATGQPPAEETLSRIKADDSLDEKEAFKAS